MFYKTSHYPMYTTKITPCSKKNKKPQVPIKIKNKNLQKNILIARM